MSERTVTCCAWIGLVLFLVITHQQDKKPLPPVTGISTDTFTQEAVTIQPSSGPLVTILATRDKQPTLLMRVTSPDGKEMLTVDLNGTVHSNTKSAIDETTQTFWKSLAENYPRICEEALRPKGKN